MDEQNKEMEQTQEEVPEDTPVVQDAPQDSTQEIPQEQVFTGTVVQDPVTKMKQHQLEAKRKSNFFSLILMLICSVINIPSILFSNSYFYFSLASTQLITIFSFKLTPDGNFAADASGNPVLRDTPVVAALAGISLIIIAVYLVLILFSKKTAVTLYIAFVLFILDTVLLVLATSFGDASAFLNLAFHVWIIYSFVVVIRTQSKLRRAQYAG